MGVILLLTTLIGGLLLLARSEESLTANAYQEGNVTKVIVSGSADQQMAVAISTAMNSLPQAARPGAYAPPAPYPPQLR